MALRIDVFEPKHDLGRVVDVIILVFLGFSVEGDVAFVLVG